MSTVFVLGAGTSYRDELVPAERSTWTSHYFVHHKHCTVESAPNPPLITGFFDKNYIWDEPETVSSRHKLLVEYIQRRWGIYDGFGTGKWASLSLETVFTSLAIDNEFGSPDTAEFADSQFLLIDLKRYILSVLAHATMSRYGRFTRILAERLHKHDSVINFNYDLLLDDELLARRAPQYENFSRTVRGKSLFKSRAPSDIGRGIYLKMHGSQNWTACTNPSCRRSGKMQIHLQKDRILYDTGVGPPPRCETCNGQVSNVLVPPLLHKQVMQSRILRGVWGAAYKCLQGASRIVVIGYSFPTADFYTEWLFRRALDHDEDTKVWIVNPATARKDFRGRMESIFPAGFDTTFKTFDRIGELLEAAGLAGSQAQGEA